MPRCRAAGLGAGSPSRGRIGRAVGTGTARTRERVTWQASPFDSKKSIGTCFRCRRQLPWEIFIKHAAAPQLATGPRPQRPGVPGADADIATGACRGGRTRKHQSIGAAYPWLQLHAALLAAVRGGGWALAGTPPAAAVPPSPGTARAVCAIGGGVGGGGPAGGGNEKSAAGKSWRERTGTHAFVALSSIAIGVPSESWVWPVVCTGRMSHCARRGAQGLPNTCSRPCVPVRGLTSGG